MSHLIALREVDQPERFFRVDDTGLVLGSGTDADIVVTYAGASERHAVIRVGKEGLSYSLLVTGAADRLLREGKLGPLAKRPGEEVMLRAGDCLLLGEETEGVRIEVLDEESSESLSTSSSDVTETDRPGKVVAARTIGEVEFVDARLRQQDAGAVAVLYRMVKSLRANRAVEDIANGAAEEIFRGFPQSTHVTVFLAGSDPPGRLEPACMRQRRRPESSDGAQKHIISRALLERVVEKRESLLVVDAAASFADSRSVSLGEIRSCMCIPLLTPDRLIGVLQVDSRRKMDAFDRRDVDILTVFGDQLASALENAALREKLEAAEARLRRENQDLRRTLEEQGRLPILIGDSPGMKEVRRMIGLAAGKGGVREPVLICGETGTGKDLAAEIIHASSGRREGPFVKVNCGAIPGGLMESEFFGHVRGAFTGAFAAREGLFAAASGGTLFLNEVADLPLEMQVKLLLVLEDKKIRPVGGNESRLVDVRIVAATNKDLQRETAERRFREDLFYRLKGLRIDLPPLRERREDIPTLAQRFLSEYRTETGVDVPGFEPELFPLLQAYSWPGNVRELRSEVRGAAVYTPGGSRVPPSAFPASIRSGTAVGAPPRESTRMKKAMDPAERSVIEQALGRFGWNLSRTAAYLGVSRPGLRDKMKRLGIRRPTDASEEAPGESAD